jgi:hypothetical protein
MKFCFQLNSDFISNSNLNPSRLQHPYISSDGLPPCIPHSNFASKPNPSCHPRSTTIVGAPSSSPPLFRRPPTKLNPVPVVRSQKNCRKNNHVKSRYVASVIYNQSLVVVSHWCCDFSDELKVNLTSPVTSS